MLDYEEDSYYTCLWELILEDFCLFFPNLIDNLDPLTVSEIHKETLWQLYRSWQQLNSEKFLERMHSDFPSEPELLYYSSPGANPCSEVEVDPFADPWDEDLLANMGYRYLNS